MDASERQMHFTSPPDMGAFFKMLSQMPKEEQEKLMSGAEEAMTRFHENMQASSANLLERYRQGKKQCLEFEATSANMHMLRTSQSWDVKPAGGATTPSGKLPLIRAAELMPNSTHRGRRLLGTVAEDAYFTGSAAVLLQDPWGDYVEIAVYGIPGMNSAFAAKVFHKGRTLAVREPFYKIRADGSLGIRIDNPAEVESCELPKCMGSWRDVGNEYFKLHKMEYARECYELGLHCARKAGGALPVLAVLHTNCALCYAKQGSWASALRSASIAAGLDPANVKAHYRQAEALTHLSAKSGRALAARALKRWPSEVQLGKLAKAADCGGSDGDADEWAWHAQVLHFPSLETPTSSSDRTTSRSRSGVPPPLADRIKTLEAFKKKGGEAFTKGDLDHALRYYEQAIKLLMPEMEAAALIFSNRAAVGLSEAEAVAKLREALADAATAALLMPAHAKAWIRRARAMERLHLPGAQDALDGVDLPEAMEEATALRERSAAAAKVKPVSKVSTEEQFRAREARKFDGPKPGELNTFEMQRMAEMTEMMMQSVPEKQRAKLQKELGLPSQKVASYHIEFPKERGWPASVDPERAARVLADSQASGALACTTTMAMRKGFFTFDEKDLMKRLHGAPWRLQCLSNHTCKPGDVLDALVDPTAFFKELRYDMRVRSSFANCLNRKEIWNRGTLHVAVGFTDLGTLLTCELREPPARRRGPLRFVGYEMSAFNVAKTRVIVAMLQDTSVPLEHIMQVWYSAAWTTSCAQSFHKAASKVAASVAKEEQVQSYLHHWIAAAPVKLSTARACWLDLHTRPKDWTSISCMKRHKDRMALCHQLLTGDLLCGEAPATGSLPMWSVPPGSPPLDTGETAFNAVSFVDLLSEVGSSDGPDVVCCLEQLILRRLERLRRWLLGGAVAVEVRQGEVCLRNKALLEEIASMKPWTMSWSNILDHMHLHHFHEMARQCSVHGDTIHFGYSMNWVTAVWGTCIADYHESKEGMNSILDTADDGIVQMGEVPCPVLKPKELLILPPPDTPLNYASYVVAIAHHQHWVRHFSSDRHGKPVPRMATSSPMGFYCPLHQTSTALALSWTYDEKVQFLKEGPP